MKLQLEDVKKFLPHREPFLFVDGILDMHLAEGKEGQSNLTVKDVIDCQVIGHYRTKKEHPIFEGHFPGNPILPGVVQIEMMAQVSSFALMKIYPHWEQLQMDVMLLGVNTAKFRKPVVPEMDLSIITTCEKVRGPFMTNNCRIEHNGEVMSEASVLASVKFTEKN